MTDNLTEICRLNFLCQYTYNFRKEILNILDTNLKVKMQKFERERSKEH